MDSRDTGRIIGDLGVGMIVYAMVKSPAQRLIGVITAVIFGALWAGAAFINAYGPDGDGPNYLCLIFAAGCFGIAWLFVRWYRQGMKAQKLIEASAVANATPAQQAGITALAAQKKAHWYSHRPTEDWMMPDGRIVKVYL